MDAVMTAPLRMNELAAEIADELDEHAPLFRVVSHTLASGARVIDAGVETDGGNVFVAGVSLPSVPRSASSPTGWSASTAPARPAS